MKRQQKQSISVIYLVGFIFSLSLAIPSFINSTFLNELVPEKTIGLFYTIASLITIVILIWIPAILQKLGNYRITFTLLWINIITLLIIAFSKIPVLIMISFILYLVSVTLIMFNLDVFLENLSTNNDTGKIRGFYLSMQNIAWVLAPLVLAFLLTNGNYWKIYSLVAFLLIPIIWLLFHSFSNFKDPLYEKTSFWETLKIVWQKKNVYKIFISNLLLRFFYSWMVIYTPIYLHQYIGFNWNTIGIIFAIMLLPFFLLEFPLGKIADKKLGEKEILNTGFVIMGVTTGILTFITSTSPIVWATLLFITRIGASMVEIMTESYFFKKIDGEDTNILSFFRMTRPIAYTISPLIASILLFFIKFNFLFIILGTTIIVIGLSHGLTIKDTK